jgi:LmbE family N-acetylglucosaminyl deacetylase
MAKAAAAGHRVVLVVATRGEHGEPVPGVLADGEQLWERRVVEVQASAEVLGADRVDFLGYVDSGMMGEPTNDDPACFWQADLDEAADRLAAILREVDADILTIYDWHGNYGHPDHIQVHRVGAAAAERYELDAVFQATMNRDRMKAMMGEALEAGLEELTDDELEDRRRMLEEDAMGEPESVITHAIDVVDFVDHKRRAMQAHASQISDDSFFMKMPDEVFAMAFGTEWFVELGGERAEGAPFAGDLFVDPA